MWVIRLSGAISRRPGIAPGFRAIALEAFSTAARGHASRGRWGKRRVLRAVPTGLGGGGHASLCPPYPTRQCDRTARQLAASTAASAREGRASFLIALVAMMVRLSA